MLSSNSGNVYRARPTFPVTFHRLVGAKCNMAVYKARKPAASDNCLLFHCDTEQDCPLMMAGDGVNTYDIFKGNTATVHGGWFSLCSAKQRSQL